MTSQKQIAANRRNAKRSTGPRTAKGKTIASRNATKHGLTSEEIIIQGENSNDLQLLNQGLQIELQPNGVVEQELVNQITMCLWRLRRMRAIETSIMTIAIASDSVDSPYSLYPNYRAYLAKKNSERASVKSGAVTQAVKDKQEKIAAKSSTQSLDTDGKKLAKRGYSGSTLAPNGRADRFGRVFVRVEKTLTMLQRYRVATEHSLQKALDELESHQRQRGTDSAVRSMINRPNDTDLQQRA